MGAIYFNYLIKQILGQDPLNKKPKPTKSEIKKVESYSEQTIVNNHPNLETKKTDIKTNNSPSIGSGIIGIISTIITLFIGLQIFGSISSSLNTTIISPAVSNMMNLIPIVLVGAVLIGIILSTMVLVSN